MRGTPRYLVGALAVVWLAACGGNTTSPGSGSTPSTSVGVAGANLGTATDKIAATAQLAFEPAMTMAHIGDIIQWTNTASFEHTITFDSESSLSDRSLQPGGTWEVKFTTVKSRVVV